MLLGYGLRNHVGPGWKRAAVRCHHLVCLPVPQCRAAGDGLGLSHPRSAPTAAACALHCPQVVNLHYMLSKTVVKARPSVLWCYKKELYLSSHKKKRMKQIKKMAQVRVCGSGAGAGVGLSACVDASPNALGWRLASRRPCERAARNTGDWRHAPLSGRTQSSAAMPMYCAARPAGP